jgi:hypothetical protein
VLLTKYQIKKDEVGGECGTCGIQDRGLVGSAEEKRPFVTPRLRWKDDIKIDLQEVRCGGMDWIDLAWDRIGGGPW